MRSGRIAIALVLLAVAATASAEVVLNFDGSGYVTSDKLKLFQAPTLTVVDLNGDGALDSESIRAFDPLVPFVAADGVNYFGPSIYGAYQKISYSKNSSVNSYGFDDRAEAYGDALYFQMLMGTELPVVNGQARILNLWLEDSFAEDAPEQIAFDENSSLFIETIIQYRTRWGGPDGAFRWVLKDSGTYYVSDVTAAPYTDDTLLRPVTLTLDNPEANAQWAAFDPTAGIDIDLDSLTFEYRQFDDLEGFGFYAEQEAALGNENLEIKLTGFAVDAVAADEPVLFPGDADNSGTVDLADLAILATNWNTIGGATWEMGDFTGEGDVDLSDLAILATNWNQSAPVALAAAELGLPAIPEPATLSLLGLGALALVRRRR